MIAAESFDQRLIWDSNAGEMQAELV